MALAVGNQVEVARAGGLHGIIEDVRPGQVLVCFDSGERQWVPDSQVRKKGFSIRPSKPAPSGSNPPAFPSTIPPKSGARLVRERGTVNPYAGSRKKKRGRVREQQPGTPRGFVPLLFSFEGRITRPAFWLGCVIALVPAFLASLPWIASASSGAAPPAASSEQVPAVAGAGMTASSLLGFAMIAFSFLMVVAVSAKRWHDHDKSGYLALLWFVPVLGALVSLISLGVLPGVAGPNRFGPDPLET